MCLITHKSNQPQIATEDITCYKLLINDINKNIFRSKYFHQEYKLNEIYKTKIQSKPYDSFTDGFYMISSMDYFNSTYGYRMYDHYHMFSAQSSGAFITYKQGFHSVKEITDDFDRLYMSNKDYVMVECTIPAGSEYIIAGNEIVSNQIVINKIIKSL